MRMRGRGRGTWRSGGYMSSQNTAAAQESQQMLVTAPAESFQPPVEMQQEQPMAYFGTGDVEMAGDVEGSNAEGNSEHFAKRKPWEKFGGGRIKKKKVPGAKNLKIRRYVQPKNAVMCLNELHPGLVYATEQEGGIGQPFCVSVEVAGQKYRGFGSSKTLAKQAAAEAALISFVKPPAQPIRSPAGAKFDEDKTPWATLASFALYKLFNEWKEGRIGMCASPSQLYGTALTAGYGLFGQSGAIKGDDGMPNFTEVINAHLLGRPTEEVKQESAGDNRKPARKIPDNASNMHPVMLLHHMKPTVQYAVSQTVSDGKPFFKITAEIDGITYDGAGTSVKKAKFYLARKALNAVYNIDSEFTLPGY